MYSQLNSSISPGVSKSALFQFHDQERDMELKKRLQEVIHKYNIKQVEVARETGKQTHDI